MARGMWKGAIGFGLVTIGVELYNAEAPERLDLDLLDKRDMSRVGYRKINKTTGKELDASNIVRGYQVSSGKYVVLSNEDLKEANPKATQTIDVVGFVAADDIPRIYYDKPYVIGPTRGSEKAYALFRDALADTRQVALAQVVLRTRQYLVAVYPFEDAMIAHLLRYDEEVRKPADLGVGVSHVKPRPQELTMAKQLIKGMETKWKPADYRDEYRDDLLKLIKARAKGAKPAHEPVEAPHETKVIDLMEALRRSVSEQGGGSSRHRSKSTAKRSRKSA